ncbi:MAG: alanine racemase [Planctomycetota bacterium]|nr:alanine racemase [Planctomycetota bacterium]
MLQARTWADVDLGALEHNLGLVRAAAGEDVAVMLVVKADAYGHGAVPVSWHLLEHGAAALGVGDSTEALELRDAGITAPIVILGAVVEGEMEAVARGGIDVTVHSGDRVRALRRMLGRSGPKVGVHIKVDTGMGRLGCHPERVPGIAREVRRSRCLELRGISTHLAAAEADGGKHAELQLRRFRRVLRTLDEEGMLPPWRHVHASSGVMSTLPEAFNYVRPGLAVYGIDPHRRPDSGLQPALSWHTQIVFLKDHRRGARIGYGGTWRAGRKTRVATLPVGYNDGYRFAFSNRATVLVRGHRCPVIGRVSMDYTTVDVTDVPDASVGDAVTLLGADGDERIRAEELARLADTIPYEILCGIGRRVKRHYLGRRHEAR